MRQRRISAVLCCAALLLARLALADAYDPPAGYYDAATGAGATLKGQLLTIMSTGQVLTRTYGDLRYSAAIQDADPNQPGNIILVYNGASVPATWDPNPGAAWNREHVWPISLQGNNPPSNTSTGHRADPHAVMPANPSINTSRGNKPFGFEDTSGSYGAVPNTNYYFPGDAFKGDIARSLFYSDTRWGPSIGPGLELTDDVPIGYQMGDLSSLVAWHYLDPADEFERRRNHAIYSQALNPSYYTNNRNAFVDRPEYVWSIYVDQMNDSQISIGGATVEADGSSTQSVDLGRVFAGGAVPGAQAFTLEKGGDDGTYYEVTVAGEATSSLSGRYNAFQSLGIDSESIAVGLNTTTATAGLRSGTVTIDNLDVTTGIFDDLEIDGHGANDDNDVFNISLTVLDHAAPSFEGSTLTTTLVHDFGAVTAGSPAPSFQFYVFNLTATPGFTADLDFDSVTTSGDAGVLTTDLAGSAGSLSLAAGAGQMFTAMLDTAMPGTYSATYALTFSDEDLPGALENSLTLTLMGEVLAAGLAGDYNDDGVVDVADYVVWRATYGQAVPAFSGADGDGDELIGDGDYTVWSQNFGAVGSGSGAADRIAAAPEPASIWSAIAALFAANVLIARRRDQRAALLPR